MKRPLIALLLCLIVPLTAFAGGFGGGFSGGGGTGSGDFKADGTVPMAGNLQMGGQSITGIGSLGATGARITKGWYTGLEITTLAGLTVGGAAITTLLQPYDADLTTWAGITAPTLAAAGDVVVASSSTALTKITKGANNSIFGVNGSGTLGFYTQMQQDDSAAHIQGVTAGHTGLLWFDLSGSTSTKTAKFQVNFTDDKNLIFPDPTTNDRVAYGSAALRFNTGGTTPRVKTISDAADTIAELGQNNNFTGIQTLGDATTNNLQKIILQKATSMADHAWQGTAILGTAGENLAQGDVVYKKYNSSAWKYYKYDADGTDKAIKPSGIATAAINSAADGVILIAGVMRDDTWNITSPADADASICASETAGGVQLCTGYTPGTGDHMIIIGHLVGSNVIQTAFGYADVVK